MINLWEFCGEKSQVLVTEVSAKVEVFYSTKVEKLRTRLLALNVSTELHGM
jgi:hypothetical protein